MKKVHLFAVCMLLLALTACGAGEETVETTEAQLTDGVSITYYHGNDRGSQLVAETTLIPKLTAQALLDLLAEQKVIPQGTGVRNFRLADGVITLDLTREFEEEAQTLSRSKEEIMVGSLVNTFLETYEASGLELTTEGRILKTRHHLYDGVLEFSN